MSINILIVDDSEVMRRLIRRRITISGLAFGTIHEAENGEMALNILRENWIDIILTDINMPIMNGDELLTKIKNTEALSDIPVIVISSEGRTSRIATIMDDGAVGFITKPFRIEDIRNIICTTLGVTTDERFIKEPENSDF